LQRERPWPAVHTETVSAFSRALGSRGPFLIEVVI
jgi:hypothetical protein